MEQINMKALLVTGGFIDDKFTLDYIKKENYDIIFAIDRGLEFFERTGLVPDYIVGDFDSVAEEVLKKYSCLSDDKKDNIYETEKLKDIQNDLLARYREDITREQIDTVIIRLTPMKDDTDTQHALQMALELGCNCIHIFGATGTRLDHVLGNLQLLGYALRQQIECMLIDPYNCIRLINKETILEKEQQFGKYVSLIPYTPEVTGITLEGFLYPLKNDTMSSFYQENATLISGVSNEIVDKTAKISLESGILILVEARDSFAHDE